MAKLSRIGVIGGGTAGYLSALALKRWRPELEVTLIESSKIPIIGVGEATTPPLLPFLHRFIGIDPHELHRKVKPTWKLGIHFAWGKPGPFNYPFMPEDVAEADRYDGDIDRASLGSLLMSARRVPMLRGADGVRSLLPAVRFAYHLDNAPFVRYLQEVAIRIGVIHRDTAIAHVVVGPGAAGEPAVDHLVSEEGETFRFDFYIDSTGFRARLMDALDSTFTDFDDSLFCDRAIAANVPHGGVLKPYTLAETMNAGWCWNIPQVKEDHRGYVFASAWLSEEEALAEMRAKNPGMGDHWKVKFRSGRRSHFWRGNVAAVGNAYGFVEPLESTAIHMALIHILKIVHLLDEERAGTEDHDRDVINRRVGAHWDYLRWFLAVHYRFNRRLDTPFWRHCREHVNVSGFEDVLADYRANGPLSARDAPRPPDAIFGPGGIDCLLLGQGVPTEAAPVRLSAEDYERRCQRRAELVGQALPHREAFDVMGDDPAWYDELVDGAASWCVADAADLPNRPRIPTP